MDYIWTGKAFGIFFVFLLYSQLSSAKNSDLSEENIFRRVEIEFFSCPSVDFMLDFAMNASDKFEKLFLWRYTIG